MNSLLLLALAIDLTLGDPPTAWHPVGWMGRLISLLERIAPRAGPRSQLLYGACIVMLLVAVFAVPVYLLLSYAEGLGPAVHTVVGAVILKSSFTVTGLRRSALKIKRLLDNDELAEARAQMHTLVSRDTGDLSRPLVVAATVESVAENTSDSLVAPIFYFLVLGVPGAVAYRVVNTFDSMIGYRGQYEHLGKFAARLDDLLNLVPARITGVMLVLAAFICRKRASAAWRTMLRDHAKAASPNAGWPMSAAAGALGVQLEKVGHYKLGEAKAALTTATIDSMLRLMYVVALVWTFFCLAVGGVRLAIAS